MKQRFSLKRHNWFTNMRMILSHVMLMRRSLFFPLIAYNSVLRLLCTIMVDYIIISQYSVSNNYIITRLIDWLIVGFLATSN
jgi:hypothetical protein